MTAFVAFVRAYAVWLYIFCVLGILVSIKVLTDARRLARTTLFSLEQERAGEQIYRAVLLIVVFLVAMGAVTAVNTILAPAVPPQEPVILRGATPTFAAIIFPTSTSLPSATPTLIAATETPFMTSTPVTVTATRPPVRATAAPPPPPPPTSPPPLFGLPAPSVRGPLPNGGTWIGEGQSNNNLVFRWDWSCERCVLGPNDSFVVTVWYVDRGTGALRTIGGGTRENFLPLARIIAGGQFEAYQKAKDDTYQWTVQVKRSPGDVPLTSPSETWKFVWK